MPEVLAQDRPRILLNFAGFQLGWFVCVLGGDLPALIYTLIYMMIHFRFVGSSKDYPVVGLLLLLGFVCDSVLQITGIIQFRGGFQLLPLWLLCLWLLFSLTINHSLNWLFSYPRGCLIAGAVAGPLSYYAGSKLGAAIITGPLLNFLIIDGMIWFGVFACLLAYQRLNTPISHDERTCHG